YADPDTRLAFAYVPNRMSELIEGGDDRVLRLMRAAHACATALPAPGCSVPFRRIASPPTGRRAAEGNAGRSGKPWGGPCGFMRTREPHPTAGRGDRRRRRLVLFAAVLVVLMLAVTGVYRLMNARTFQLAGQLTHRVETGEKVVALTFDDGPDEHTREIIDILAEQ